MSTVLVCISSMYHTSSENDDTYILHITVGIATQAWFVQADMLL